MTTQEGTVPTDRDGRAVRLRLLAATFVVVAALLAGCSGGAPTASGSGVGTASTATTPTAAPRPSAPTAADVYRDARTAALSAESGHAVGTVSRNGATVRIDLEGQANGSNQKVLITTPKAGVA